MSRLSAGTSAVDQDRNSFADRVAELVAHLGCRDLAAVVGISAGGPWAIALAARRKGLVHRVVLENSISDIAWPDRVTRIAGRIAFAPKVEKLSWMATRFAFRIAPSLTLRAMMIPLTRRSSRLVVDEFSHAERNALVSLFREMRSGRGFTIDLKTTMDSAELAFVTQPCLVVASAHDGSVGREHAEKERVGQALE